MPYNKKFTDTLYNKGWLQRVYVDENRNASQVAALIDCQKSAVHDALKRFGITIKSASEAQKLAPHPGSHAPRPRAIFKDTLHNKEWMEARSHLNASEIAKEANCSVPSAQEAMEVIGRKPPDISEAKAGRPAVYRRKGPGEPVTRTTASRRAHETCPVGPCVICGKDSEEINHINRDWQNNDADNLERVCSACHNLQYSTENAVMVDLLDGFGIKLREIWKIAREQIVNGQLRGTAKAIGMTGYLEINGIRKSLCAWARDNQLSEATVRYRLYSGWDAVKAVTEPPRDWGKILIDGIEDTVAGHARRKGIPVSNVYSRIASRSGWTIEDALNVPIRDIVDKDEGTNNG